MCLNRFNSILHTLLQVIINTEEYLTFCGVLVNNFFPSQTVITGFVG